LDVFEALRESPEVQKYLSRVLHPGGHPAYMIVGVAIWTDAKFTKSDSTSRSTAAEINAPVALAVTAATGIPLPSADVGVGGVSTATARNQINGLSSGSSIFAIEYRAVSFPSRTLF
jgi:hypothetical protein